MGSHLIGGVAGLLVWAILTAGVPLTESPDALSGEGLRLAASATTLIVSLGLLSTIPQFAIIVVSVIILFEFHAGVLYLFKQIVGDAHPLYREEG